MTEFSYLKGLGYTLALSAGAIGVAAFAGTLIYLLDTYTYSTLAVLTFVLGPLLLGRQQ